MTCDYRPSDCDSRVLATQQHARITSRLAQSRAWTQRRTLDSCFDLCVTRELRELVATNLPRRADGRSDSRCRSAWNKFDRRQFGAHATRRLQQEHLPVPFPAENTT